jgi:hypothetical protein
MTKNGTVLFRFNREMVVGLFTSKTKMKKQRETQKKGKCGITLLRYKNWVQVLHTEPSSSLILEQGKEVWNC